MRCLIIDDEWSAIEVIKNYIEKTPGLRFAGSTTRPLEGVELIAHEHIDVVFLDIQMDDLSGMDLARLLEPEVQVIFCTAFSEFGAESYDLDAVDYLLKPISYGRFLKAVSRLKRMDPKLPVQDAGLVRDDYIFVKTGKGRLEKINLDDIIFIEAKNNLICIHLSTGRDVLVNYTLKDLDNMLGSGNFIRIHHSFIIPINKIVHVENSYVQLMSVERQFPIGNNYKNIFFDKIQNRILRKE